MKFLITLLCALFIPGLAFAGTTGDDDVPTVKGKGIIAEPGEAGGAGESFVGTVIFWESDDSAAYGGPTGATIDTGTEACAVFAMSCFDTYTIVVGGGAGDELLDSTCATDLSNDTLALSFCY